MIPKMGEALDVNLAVSLHAVNDEVRATLVRSTGSGRSPSC